MIRNAHYRRISVGGRLLIYFPSRFPSTYASAKIYAITDPTAPITPVTCVTTSSPAPNAMSTKRKPAFIRGRMSFKVISAFRFELRLLLAQPVVVLTYLYTRYTRQSYRPANLYNIPQYPFLLCLHDFFAL